MVQQIIKGEVWKRSQVSKNILAVWSATTESDRFDWYLAANNYAHELANISPSNDGYHLDVARACGVIAALSPMIHWNNNKKLARQLIEDARFLNVWIIVESMACLKANARKAGLILLSDGSDDAILSILKGRKTSAFYLNMRYPDKSISMTMDRHAISIAIGRKITKDEAKYFNLTAAQYKFLVECYRWTAAKIGVNPLILQSATWVLWRREGRNTELPYTIDF